jgi:MFS family permease
MTSEEEQTKNIQATWPRAIIAGILASLIVIYFLDPILSFLGRLTLYVAGALFATYLDRLYAEVAISEPNFGFFFLAGAAGTSLGCAIGFILGASVLKKRVTSIASPPVKYVWLIAIILVVISVPLLAVTVDSYIRLKTTSTFNQRLAVIAPQISDQQRKEFLARFASMESKADFEAVMHTMDEVAVKNKVKLPKNRLYPY